MDVFSLQKKSQVVSLVAHCIVVVELLLLVACYPISNSVFEALRTKELEAEYLREFCPKPQDRSSGERPWPKPGWGI
jgi:hypothetical protein